MRRQSVLASDGARALAAAGLAAMRASNLSFCGIVHHGDTGPYNDRRQLLSTGTEGVIEVRCLRPGLESLACLLQAALCAVQLLMTGL